MREARGRNELGCSLSHWKVYRKIHHDGIEVALILEDDVRLLPDFASVVRRAASVVEDGNVYLVYFHSELKRFYRSGSVDIGAVTPYTRRNPPGVRIPPQVICSLTELPPL